MHDTDMRPVWLLDVDGVLNAGQKPGWSAPPTTRRVRVDGNDYRMRWSPRLLDGVRDLARSGTVDIRWATSWVDHIDVITHLFGLPNMPVAFTLGDAKASSPEMIGRALPLKRQVALDVVRAGRSLLWTDDDAIWESGPQRDELDAGDTLLVVPDERRGLQPAHWATIASWVAQRT